MTIVRIRALLPLAAAVASAAGLVAPAHAQPLPYGPDTCIQGFVWRESRVGDPCVERGVGRVERIGRVRTCGWAGRGRCGGRSGRGRTGRRRARRDHRGIGGASAVGSGPRTCGESGDEREPRDEDADQVPRGCMPAAT